MISDMKYHDDIWYHVFGTIISYLSLTIIFILFHRFSLWYHILYKVYDIILNIWHSICLYEIICDSKYIPTYPLDLHKSYARDLPAWTGCHLSLYAWSNEYMSSSLWFNPSCCDLTDFPKSVRLSSTWFRKILLQFGDYCRRNHDMAGCLCVSLFIGRCVPYDHAGELYTDS